MIKAIPRTAKQGDSRDFRLYFDNKMITLATGHLFFIALVASEQTGSISIKGVFPN